MADRVQPDDVFASVDLPAGAVMTSCLVVIAYVIPADDDDRGPFLGWWRDDATGTWAHLGMAEAAAADFRKALTDLPNEGRDE